MPDESVMINLFNRWEQVWHEGKFDLVPGCVAESYIRHDQKGDRTVTRDAYAAEIANIRKDRPDIRVVVYDHSFVGDRAWFRFAFKWTDAQSGANPGRHAGVPASRWQARRDMAHVVTFGHGMARYRCAGALDKSTANQVAVALRTT